MPGTGTSNAEVTSLSLHGFWILVGDKELFLPFDEFPWFAGATVEQIVDLERPHPHHLHWPELDVDLNLESIVEPQRLPLNAKA